MQTLTQNPIKLIKSNDGSRNSSKEIIPYLLKAIENADAKMKNDIENQLFRFGEVLIPELVNLLTSSNGIARATIAMVLIRLGKSSIEPLKFAYKNNENLSWIADYIINEIEGSGISLVEICEFNPRQEVLVG